MSENRLPRGIFGPRREKVAGGWTRLHNDVKVKNVKLSLCLTKHHAMTAYWGVEV